MDKILLAAFFSALAGFITAVISMVKLVNEKENKTSEFRQSWTNSARISISDLAAKLAAITANLEYQHRLVQLDSKLSRKTGDVHEKRLDHIRATLLRVREDISSNRHDLYQSLALCKLHFKPNDTAFQPIELLFEKIRNENKNLPETENDADREQITQNNYENIQRIIETGRTILKDEWERVKAGEKAYKNTKTYSFYGGMFTLFALLGVGGYALSIAVATKTTGNGLTDYPSKAQIIPDGIMCWKLQKLDESVFKFNFCTGELIEFDKGAQQLNGKLGAQAKTK